MEIITPSRIVSKKSAVGDEQCSVCSERKDGEKTKLKGSFNNIAQFYDPSSNHICFDCLEIINNLKTFGKSSIITKKGVIVALKHDIFGQYLLYPPDPPFVIQRSPIMNPQHLFWHSRIAYNKKHFPITYGTNTFYVEPDILIKLAKNSLRIITTCKTFWQSRDHKDVKYGLWNKKINKLMDEHDWLEKSVSMIDNASVGNRFALPFAIKYLESLEENNND